MKTFQYVILLVVYVSILSISVNALNFVSTGNSYTIDACGASDYSFINGLEIYNNRFYYTNTQDDVVCRQIINGAYEGTYAITTNTADPFGLTFLSSTYAYVVDHNGADAIDRYTTTFTISSNSYQALGYTNNVKDLTTDGTSFYMIDDYVSNVVLRTSTIGSGSQSDSYTDNRYADGQTIAYDGTKILTAGTSTIYSYNTALDPLETWSAPWLVQGIAYNPSTDLWYFLRGDNSFTIYEYIENNIPEIISFNISNTLPIYANENLDLYFEVYDADGDNLSIYTTWYYSYDNISWTHHTLDDESFLNQTISSYNNTIYNTSSVGDLEYTKTVNGVYWKANINITDNMNSVSTNSSVILIKNNQDIVYDVFTDNSSISYPEIGDTISLNAPILSAYDTLLYCNFDIYNISTSNWNNISTYIINTSTPYTLNINYTITDYYNVTYNDVTWRLFCQDNTGNTNYSQNSTFIVQDISSPIINILDTNSFNNSNNSIVSTYLNNFNVDINITDPNLYQYYINITCDINGTIYYSEDLNIVGTYFEINSSPSIGNMDFQKCTTELYTSDQIVNSNINFYEFYIGSLLNLTTLNIYDNSSFSDWTVHVFSNNSNPSWDTDVIVNNTSTQIAISNGSYILEFSHPYFFNQTYTLNVTNFNYNVTYESYQAVHYVYIQNVKTGLDLSDFNITYDNLYSTYNKFSNTTSYLLVSYLNASTYNITIQKNDYDNYTDSISFSYLENRTDVFGMSFIATFILYDERTLNIFDVNSADSINFLLFCPSSTYTTVITSNTTSIPIDCNYTKFKFTLNYGSTSYYRNFILTPNEALNVSVYLINLNTTDYVYNSFIIDDLLEEYENPSILIKKNIGSETIQITGDYVDIENKVGAYLIENNEYIVEVHSDNNPVRIMGAYSADIGGEKSLRLYDIDLATDASSYNDNVYVAASNVYNNATNESEVQIIYSDLSSNTQSVAFKIYLDTYGGTLLASSTIYNTSDIEYTWNSTAYQSSRLIAAVEFTYNNNPDTYLRIIEDNTQIEMPILGYVNQSTINWFFTLLIGVLAIMATIRTGNYMAIAIIGFGSFFTYIGWYSLSWSALGLALLISLLSLLKESEKEI